MVGESRAEGAKAHFADYIAELRDFFRSRQVHYGAPGDFLGLVDQMHSSAAFMDEMGSMARSILYREEGSIGSGELLEILTVAVSGVNAESASAESDEAVREVFRFLHRALREAHEIPAEVEEIGADDDRPITAGDILAVPREDEMTEDPSHRHSVLAARDASAGENRLETDGVYARAALRAGWQEMPDNVRDPALPAEEFQGPHEGERSMAQGWLIPAVAAGLAVIGIGVYIARPSAKHLNAAPTSAGSLTTESQLASNGTCVAPMQAGASRNTVQERSRWTHNLLDQKLYDAALLSLQEIARIDPGFPGIQLQESEALMNLKRPDEAREAVDGQIAVSECLARLPAAQLDTYCAAQFTSTSGRGCREQLMHIRQAAQLQAALIHLELGHRVDPDSTPSPGTPELPAEAASTPETTTRVVRAATPIPPLAPHPARRVAPLPPATEGDAAQPALPKRVAKAKTSADRRPQEDDSLRKGEGTDSVFGAYQKPEPQ